MADKKLKIEKKEKKKDSKFNQAKDYFHIIAHMVTDFVNERYKIKQTVEEVKENLTESLYTLKTGFIKALIETILLSTGLISLIAGLILMLGKVMSLEFVLTGYGLLACVIVLFQMKLRP